MKYYNYGIYVLGCAAGYIAEVHYKKSNYFL